MESPDLPIEVSLSASGVYIFRCQLCQVWCKQTKKLFIWKNGKNVCKKKQKKILYSVAGVVWGVAPPARSQPLPVPVCLLGMEAGDPAPGDPTSGASQPPPGPQEAGANPGSQRYSPQEVSAEHIAVLSRSSNIFPRDTGLHWRRQGYPRYNLLLSIYTLVQKWLFCIFLDLSVPVVFERVTSKLTLSLGELLIAQEVIVCWSYHYECV